MLLFRLQSVHCLAIIVLLCCSINDFIKVKWEAIKGSRDYGIDPKYLVFIANEIKMGIDLGVECAIVIGGGNIFRGLAPEWHGSGCR